MNTFNTTRLTGIHESANTVEVLGTVHHRSTARPTLRRQFVAATLFLLIVTAVAVVGSLLTTPHTEGWYAEADKVPWTPPNAVFGPAWSLLYLLIAVAGFLLWRAGFTGAGHRNRARSALTLFVIQLVLNALWSPVFFAGYPVAGDIAWWIGLGIIVVLIVTVVLLILAGRKSSSAAAWCLFPYLLWLVFASTLNAGVIALNS